MPGANRYFGSYKINSDETLDARVGEKSIPSEVWDEYQGITRVLIDVHPIVSVYECVTRNGQALFSAIEAIHEEIMTGKAQSNWRTDFVYEVFFTLNQHVANFISSTRAFIDHAEGHLKRTFGENSPEFRNFKQGTAGCMILIFHIVSSITLETIPYTATCPFPTSISTVREMMQEN
jgi:hypothetical protein